MSALTSANRALRDGLLAALREHGPLSTEQAGKSATGRYEPTAHRHLVALERQGLVTRLPRDPDSRAVFWSYVQPPPVATVDLDAVLDQGADR